MKLLFVLTLSALLLASHSSIACSCMGESTVSESYKYADAIFSGTVASQKVIELIDSNSYYEQFSMFPDSLRVKMSTRHITEYKLLLHDTYKGLITNDTITILTGMGGGDCGVNLNIDQKYLLYASDSSYLMSGYDGLKNTFWTNICTRTGEYNATEHKELTALTAKHTYYRKKRRTLYKHHK